jgi:hypothetical protein
MQLMSERGKKIVGVATPLLFEKWIMFSNIQQSQLMESQLFGEE